MGACGAAVLTFSRSEENRCASPRVSAWKITFSNGPVGGGYGLREIIQDIENVMRENRALALDISQAGTSEVPVDRHPLLYEFAPSI